MSSRRRGRPEDQGASGSEPSRPVGRTPLDPASGPQDSPGDALAGCRRAATGFLARREHSRVELERKLAKRSIPTATITAVLDELEQSGLLAEDRFAESFVRARVARGQGPVRIRLELAGHGIDDAEDVLGDGYDWPALAAAARVKRFGSAAPRAFKERARQARFLEYRGFTGAQIAAALEFGDESD